jgi:hypothetical protein
VDTLAEEYLEILRDASSGYVQAKVAATKVSAPAGKAAVVPSSSVPRKATSMEELAAQHEDAWARERI